MINIKLTEKLAELAVKTGANVQKGQYVFINASTETKDLAREIAKQAYLAGAGVVTVNWSDEYVSKYGYMYRSVESLQTIPQWTIDKMKDFIDKGGCVISIASPIPDLNKEVEPVKLQALNIATRKAYSFYYDHMMGSKTQWSIVAAPNPIWAAKVFPTLSEEDAVEALSDAIFKASRVTLDNDPIAEWTAHNERLLAHNTILNNYNFETLYFKNSIGTDISIKIVDDHIWAGGGELTPEGILFNPNIPTEENFTMPHKYGVNGKVVATKPLNYQGKLIKDFWFEFKEGKVVDFDAKENKDALESLLNLDEGSRYIGEIALISYDSPISNLGILFYNTLFDENASCHMALGRAYPTNIKNGVNLSLEELKERGYNSSITHNDFMFGSKDLSIVGTTKSGEKVVIFKDGNFVI